MGKKVLEIQSKVTVSFGFGLQACCGRQRSPDEWGGRNLSSAESRKRKIRGKLSQTVTNLCITEAACQLEGKKKKSLSWMTGCNVWRLEMGLWALKRLSKEKGTEETTSKAVLSFSGNKMAGGKRRCTWTFCVFTVCLSVTCTIFLVYALLCLLLYQAKKEIQALSLLPMVMGAEINGLSPILGTSVQIHVPAPDFSWGPCEVP